MANTDNRVTVKTDKTATPAPQTWQPFDSLRREVDRLFDDFNRGVWTPFVDSSFAEPLRRAFTQGVPAVDVTESEKTYEVTAELPGLDEKNIQVTIDDSGLTIKGEKSEESEEKKKDYYVQERRFGSYERSFRLPDNVDADKVEAKFKNGVLTVTLPKSAKAQAAQKTITVKAA
jgi:HSP20 family protein